ncbi:D-alanyl-D-alanine carboxypeptidase [Flavobacteriales bacterium ALC-1]|nr:D-alanyl-D-alanine carboxypeptidase [Flavobacteriales bacterium ALC-1]
MKLILLAFSCVLFVFSCNTNDKKIIDTKIVEASVDTIIQDTIIQLKNPHLSITKDFVLGKFDYKNDTTFVKVDTKHSLKVVYLQNEVYKVFLDMVDSAKVAGVELKIVSGTRNFKEQKAIWERKWKKYNTLEPLQRALKILEYSSMPSSSRHHWGTDIDLNSLNNSYFNSGKGLRVYEWLITHANDFGFYQVYTEKDNNRTGYNLEKWHWSYLPFANKYLEFYNKRIINDDINGFDGFEQAQKVKIIKDYVNGISKKAKDYK